MERGQTAVKSEVIKRNAFSRTVSTWLGHSPFHLRLMLVGMIVAMISGNALAVEKDKKKFKVVTTFTVIQDIAQNVAGDAATVESITKPGARSEEHTSELQSRQ